MRRFFALLLAATLAACSGPSGGGASSSQNGFGFSERGRLASGDARYGDQYVDGYSVGVATDPVRPLAITLDSGAFDAVMVLIDPSGNARVIADCEGSADACIRLEAPARGTWHVRVTSATPGASGGYTFAVASPLPGIVAPAPLTSRAAPLLPLRGAPTPEAPPTRPAPPPAPAPRPEPRPAPEASGEDIGPPTADQAVSGSFTGANATHRLDGRDRPAAALPTVLLAGDEAQIRFTSDAFTPFAALVREGRTVATARGARGSVEGAYLQYEVPASGDYTLILGTTDAALVGAFEASISFVRDPERIRRAPQVEPVTRPNGLPHSQISALRATFEAASDLGALRGALLTRDPAAGDVYLSEMPIPGSSQTNVICQGERCSVFAVFPTRDATSAVNTAANLVRIINTVTDYALDEPATPSDPNAFMELVSDDVSVRVSYDANRYDQTLGVPVRLRIDSR